MKIGICDDLKEELEKAKVCILDNIQLTQEDSIDLYYPEEIVIDIENNVYDCDIMVLDIDFPGVTYNGIHLGKLINESAPMCQIIYLTHILDFAPDVYETKHCYFVLKNNMSVMLPQALKKAFKIYDEEKKHVFIKIMCDSHPVFIPMKDIIYIEKVDRKIKIHTVSKNYESYATLASLKKDLSMGFIRCHGSFIIHLKHVTYMGTEEVELDNQIKIPLGKTYVYKVKEAYTKYWSNRV